MKNICLTFDYELYFGKKSGTVENCLLKPTNEILKVLNRNGQKATFFIDVLFLERLESVLKETPSYKKIIDQLHHMIVSGHRIELHLHPHWLDAKYTDGQWVFPHYNHYGLQSLPDTTITDLFVRGTQFLEEIARQVDSSYKVLVFRAGGWGIQPFSKLKDGFIKAGIKIDSTVMPGFSDWGGLQVFDFSHAPDLSFWKFSDDPCCPNDQGSFWEIPISVYQRRFIERLSYFFYMRISEDIPFGDGQGLLPANQPISSVLSRLRSPGLSLLTTDEANKSGILRYIEESEKDLFVIINHPKMMLKERGLKNIDECRIFTTVLLKNAVCV
jgi:hypothetical protein